jgi:multimeric flavodoxin WrbA
MNVLGVNGSGREGGNTAALVRAILDGAAAGGAETELWELARWEIRGCTACKRCKQTHRCVIGDDMQRLYDVAPETDVLVLASPIYLDHVTAQMMAFIQRTYCYLGLNLENHYPRPGARAVLGITYGAGGDETYRYVLDWMAERLKGYFGIPTVATFAIASTQHEPIIPIDHPELARAREFGRTLASA